MNQESDNSYSYLIYSMVTAVFITSVALVYKYIVKLFDNNEERNDDRSKNDKGSQYNKKKKEVLATAKDRKKSDTKWSTRADKQGFTHPWLIKTFKGHTGEVLDMDFSANNKYLASCGDEDISADNESTGSSSESSKDSSRSPSVEPSPRVRLSRRQRKNRRREDVFPENKKKVKVKMAAKSSALKPEVGKGAISENWIKMRMTFLMFTEHVQEHKLSREQQVILGYPQRMEPNSDIAVIFKNCSFPSSRPPQQKTKFDVNAEEFVPQTEKPPWQWWSRWDRLELCDSGFETQSDSDSSPTQVIATHRQRHEPSYGRCFSDFTFAPGFSLIPGLAYQFYPYHNGVTGLTWLIGNFSEEGVITRTCARCDKRFYTTTEEYITQETCKYHFGKRKTFYIKVEGERVAETQYTCCKGGVDSKGCCIANQHVHNGLEFGSNYVTGFVTTKPKMTPGVYALDCEMCYTVLGLELTKVTLVAPDCRKAYETFVKPARPIVDYNTRFSGISARDLRGAPSLERVQADLLKLISAETILVGHGLENDLRALRMVHHNVIDTGVCYPHARGLPYRLSLQKLTESVLGRQIQNREHDSFEDAKACMELLLHFIWQKLNGQRGPKYYL